jgi:hypothetical protein
MAILFWSVLVLVLILTSIIVLQVMCSSFSPNTDIDFLNALLVYCEPLSALTMGLFLLLPGTISLCDTRPFSIEIMAFAFTAHKSKQ